MEKLREGLANLHNFVFDYFNEKYPNEMAEILKKFDEQESAPEETNTAKRVWFLIKKGVFE